MCYLFSYFSEKIDMHYKAVLCLIAAFEFLFISITAVVPWLQCIGVIMAIIASYWSIKSSRSNIKKNKNNNLNP